MMKNVWTRVTMTRISKKRRRRMRRRQRVNSLLIWSPAATRLADAGFIRNKVTRMRCPMLVASRWVDCFKNDCAKRVMCRSSAPPEAVGSNN